MTTATPTVLTADNQRWIEDHLSATTPAELERVLVAFIYRQGWDGRPDDSQVVSVRKKQLVITAAHELELLRDAGKLTARNTTDPVAHIPHTAARDAELFDVELDEAEFSVLAGAGELAEDEDSGLEESDYDADADTELYDERRDG